jgi:hypothetical protein
MQDQGAIGELLEVRLDIRSTMRGLTKCMTRRSEVRCRCWLKIDPEHERDKQNAE